MYKIENFPISFLALPIKHFHGTPVSIISSIKHPWFFMQWLKEMSISIKVYTTCGCDSELAMQQLPGLKVVELHLFLLNRRCRNQVVKVTDF